MLGAGYFLKIAEINFQQEKPICPNLKNKFPVTWPFHRLSRPLCDVKSSLCLLRASLASLDFHLHVTTANISSLYLINALGIYLILGVQVGRSHYCNNLNKTNTLSAKISREFKYGSISTPSVDTSRPSRDPYHSLKFQHLYQNPRWL